MNHDQRSESGIVLLELLIAMILIVGSITVAHAVVWVRQKNQHEMTFYLNRLKSQQSQNSAQSKR
ncbi:MAG: hypothetical protein RLZZ325_1284 [Pseudomonadota bacterium]